MQHPPTEPLRLWTFADMEARANMEPPGWVVEHVILAAGTTLFAGSSHAGKTRFMTALCVAVTAGVPLAGLPVRQGPIAILYLEHMQSDLVAKIRAAARGMGVDPATLPILQIPLTASEWKVRGVLDLQRIRDALDAAGVILVVVDSMRRVAEYKDSDTEAINRACALVGELTSDNKRAAVTIHHLNASGGVLGGDAFEAAVDTTIIATGDSDSLSLKVKTHSTRPYAHTFSVTQEDDGAIRRYERMETPVKIGRKDEVDPIAETDNLVIGALKSQPGITKGRIPTEIGRRASAVDASLARLESRRVIERLPDGPKGAIRYTLSDTKPQLSALPSQ